MKIIIYIFCTLVIMVIIFGAVGVRAQSGFNPNSSGPGCSAGIQNPLSNTNDLYTFIANVLHAVAQLGAAVCVFFVIYSGFLYVTAQGNEEKLKRAHRALLYTVIGVAILLGAELIAIVIKNTITKL